MNTHEGANDPPPITCPFTVGIDSREQRPYTFRGLRANANQKHALIDIRTTTMSLSTGFGDYTIAELPKIAIERKSKEDLFGSIGQRRENFEDRLLRMGVTAGCWYSAIVIEAEISELIAEPPSHSKLNPKSLMRTILAWEMRYPQVAWWFLPNRQAAEAWTFRLLERFWELHRDRIADLAHAEADGSIVGDPEALRFHATVGTPEPRPKARTRNVTKSRPGSINEQGSLIS